MALISTRFPSVADVDSRFERPTSITLVASLLSISNISEFLPPVHKSRRTLLCTSLQHMFRATQTYLWFRKTLASEGGDKLQYTGHATRVMADSKSNFEFSGRRFQNRNVRKPFTTHYE